MPELSLTDDQYDRLQAVRGDMEAAFVDSYGSIPMADVVEYLLDTYTPPDERETEDDAYRRIATADYPALQRVASDVSGVPGSGINADEMRGKLLVELGPDTAARKLRAAADDADDSPAEDSSAGADDTGDSPAGAADTDDTESGASDAADSGSKPADTEDSESGGEDTGEEGSDATDGTGNDPLSAVNQLLDAHDGKWRESEGDAPYEVDLPDGSTASARTRDDVRQLLFRHY